ncbi:hypothetical protein [Paenibacillus thermotolerans]|uniref:hypothetical protein n=1 Tax=Paenibacillus thermotolerans TaxID=3027807 RepID=UPI0023680D58|nr:MULTISPECIES: hypothetical protein [unclassified Paenibacillus]
MKKISAKHGLWLLILVTSIAGVFLTKGSIYTKLNKNTAGGLTLPSFTLPIIAVVVTALIEQLRERYPDIFVNAILCSVWILFIALIAVNS